jgi:MYXO-CTERM domain-containing protein
VPDLPADQVGGSSRTIISFDCGYGVAQVTSGMHKGESPGFDRDRVAKEPIYNLATGTQILALIWAQAKCVGDNQPAIIEDWYTATWAYNGYAYVNNPNNPNYDANRGVWDPAIGGGAPYQERIFGFIEHTGGQWTPTELAYPNLGDIGDTNKPGTLPEPSCASPTDCTSTREVHRTACDGALGTGGGPGTGGGSGAAGGGVASSGAGGDSAGAGGDPAGAGGSAGAARAASGSTVTGAGAGQGQGEGPVAGCACHLGKEGDTPAMAAVALWVAGLAALRLRRKAP